MHLSHLTLANFRGFATLDLELDPVATVLIGRNGSGKTSIWRALRLGLSKWCGAFDGSHMLLDEDDVRWGLVDGHRLEPQLPCSLKGRARVGEQTVEWGVSKRSPDVAWTVDGSLDEIARDLRERVAKGEDVDLPVVAAFAARLGRHGPETSTESDGKWLNSRTLAYRGALEGADLLGDVSTWLANREKALNQRLSERLDEGALDALVVELRAGLKAGKTLSAEQLLRQRAGVDRAPETEALVGAVLTCLDGARGLRYDIAAEELRIGWDDGRELPYRLLSDGQQRVAGIAGQLAWLAYRLNPHHGAEAPKMTAGVVLIDEIELHLHPEWQQTVVGNLRRAFPRVQFIMTTHSPQVLSTVHARHIRRLSLEDGVGHAAPVELQTRGVESGDVLATAMGVDPVPDVPEWQMLLRYRAMIEDGHAESDDARALRAELDAHFGPRHPLMFDCDRLIRFVRFSRRREGEA